MNNAQIAVALEQVADLLEFQGANPFRVRAYRNASRTLHELAEPIVTILEDSSRKLTDISGIGKDLAEKITTLVQTGTLPLLEELQSQIPQSVLTLSRVPGVGPKKSFVLYKELNVTTLDDLKAACESQKVRKLKGFGEKTEQAILEGLAIARSGDQRMYWAAADVQALTLLEHLRAGEDIEQIEMAGSYRRGRDTIGDLDVLVVSRDPNAVMDRLAAVPTVSSVLGRGDTKMSVRLYDGLQVDLRVVPEESFGAALQYFTGSKAHNVVLRGLAKSRGLKINEYGVFRMQGGPKEADDENESADAATGEYIAGRTEAELYAALNLPVFPPEIREARWEFDWAAAGTLPRLIEESDIQGDLHMHTQESDGKGTIDDMVASARERGLKYIAITDHSKRVSMANGLDGPRLRHQWLEIDQVNERLRDEFLVLKGVEVDILERGGLDLEDDVLAEADWVVASIHYGQNQPRDQITRRLIEAIENPHVSAIAHPTGRIINRRKPYDLDFDKVLRAAREHGKMLELNANPARLDLDDVMCAAARQHGVPIVISTDAHSPNGMEVLRYGILQARRGGLTKADVANTRTWPEMKKLIGRKG